MIKGVGRQRQFNHSSPVDYGYVIIPTKQDRDAYVTQCFRRERVTIVGDNGMGMIKDCYISRTALREINFPIDDSELGDAVVYITNAFNNKPIIVGKISKESDSQLLDEGEFRLEKSYNNSRVSVTGKAKTGDILIDVENNDSKGALIINVTGKDDGSSLEINVKGNAKIYADDSVNLETTGSINIKSIDEADEEKYSSIVIDNTDISIESQETFNVTTKSGINLISEGTIDINNGNLTIEP